MSEGSFAGGDEQNALDYVYVLARWRRLVFWSVFVVTLAAVGISLILPQTWTAQTKLMIPEAESGQVGLSLLIGNAMPSGLRGLVGGSTASERLLTLLGSKRVLSTIVDEFSLVSSYQVEHLDEAIEILSDQIETELDEDGTLTIRFTAREPQSAADMANALARQLDTVNREYKRQQARDLRRFLAQRVEVTEQELRTGAHSLKVFQEQHGLVDLEAQILASVDVLKSIVQELAVLEVDLSLMNRQLHAEHEDKKVLELKVAALREQLQRLQGDLVSGVSSDEPLKSLGPPLKQLPELMLKHTELTLTVELRAEILRFLGSKFEEAKYREALNTPTLQVLDTATPPRTRSGPQRTLIVAGSLAVSTVLSVVLAFLFESWNRLGRDNQEKMASIRREFRWDD